MATVLPMGVLLPDSILHNQLIAVLAAFVAINTIVYVTLSVAKILPKLYLRDWLASRNRRAETRSIAILHRRKKAPWPALPLEIGLYKIWSLKDADVEAKHFENFECDTKD